MDLIVIVIFSIIFSILTSIRIDLVGAMIFSGGAKRTRSVDIVTLEFGTVEHAACIFLREKHIGHSKFLDLTRVSNQPTAVFEIDFEIDLHDLFQIICKPDSCLHHLLPPSRDTSVISRLRSSTSLPRPISRTKKFQSLLNFALNNCRPPL